jgi:hypothetical protein
MMFLKLDRKFFIDSYTEEDEYISYGKTINGHFKGIRYLKSSIKNLNEILEIIPTENRKDFSVSLMKVTAQVPPHTDSQSATVINLYIKAQDDITQFYSPKVKNPTVYQIPNQTNGVMFDIKDLEPTDQFVANSGDIYVLDVTKPHSVISRSNTDRIAVGLSTYLPFTTVIELLEKQGSYV